MSDLTTGGNGVEDWAYPNKVYIDGSYVTNGMEWTGNEAATIADVKALQSAFGDDVEIDKGTLVGLYDWRWTSLWSRNSTGQPIGGVGSTAYENQHVGESQGASFSKKDMWYTTCAGQLVYGMPPEAGCYHWVYAGGGYKDAHQGPEKGSPADKARGDGEFYWDDERKLYDVR